jgi:LPXTG-site transpeptidase (sortase) family protein
MMKYSINSRSLPNASAKQSISPKVRIRDTVSYAFLWFAVFILSMIFLTYANAAPPEIREAGKFFLGMVSGSNNKNQDFLSGVSTTTEALPEVSQLSATSTLSESVNSVPFVVPVRIVIDKIGVNGPVSNPDSEKTEDLDEALLKGAVRYPGSGSLLDNDNIFIFGHSSFLPVVNNPAYRIFNRLNQLGIGDDIKLHSEKMEYIFRVIKIEKVKADEALIRFETGKKKLVLSTCDSFGKKTDRFVVEAEFIGSRAL